MFFQSVLIPVNVGWSYLLRPFQNSYGCAVEMWEWVSNFVKRWLDRALLTYAGIKVKPSYKNDRGVGVGGGGYE